MSNEPRPEPPPEGLLLEQARDRLGISQNEAGRQAGISGTRWRQIVKEVAATMTSPRGVKTLARMAGEVGVTYEQMEGVGRDDVAEALRRLNADRETAEEPTVVELAAELAAVKAKNIEIERRLKEIEGRGRQRKTGS